MRIILIDDYGNRQLLRVDPEDVIKVQDVFAPCLECSNAVLAKDINDDGICSRCVQHEIAAQATPIPC